MATVREGTQGVLVVVDVQVGVLAEAWDADRAVANVTLAVDPARAADVPVATAYGALERGCDLTLVQDAHTTDELDLGDGVVVDAPTVINDLNTVFLARI